MIDKFDEGVRGWAGASRARARGAFEVPGPLTPLKNCRKILNQQNPHDPDPFPEMQG